MPGVLFAVSSSGGTPVPIGAKGDYHAFSWIDSSRIVFARQSNQFKTRTIYVASIKDGIPKAIHEDKEEKFWSLPDWETGTEPVPSPDGRWIAFLSDTDGWDQIYVMPSAGGTPVQLTKGHFEAWRPAWSHDSTRIAFDANEPDRPGDRRLGIATLSEATPRRPQSRTSLKDAGPTSSPAGPRMTSASSISTQILATPLISSL